MSKVNTTDNQPHFKLHEGSNYKVIMTFERTEIITFEHCQKLAEALFSGEYQFVTVNDVIVQTKDIRMIQPTKEKTTEQVEQILLEQTEAQKQEIEIMKLKDEIAKIRADFFNGIYGNGNWGIYEMTLPENMKKFSEYMEVNHPKLLIKEEELKVNITT